MNEYNMLKAKMNFKNKRLMNKISSYIYVNRVNKYTYKQIQIDTAKIFLDYQHRGEEPVYTIGDYKAYCDELIKNSPRKNWFAILVEVLFIIALSVVTIIPLICVILFVFPNEIGYVKGGYAYCEKDIWISMVSYSCASGLGFLFMSKYTYYLLFYVLLSFVFTLLLHYIMAGINYIQFNIIMCESAMGVLTIALFVIIEQCAKRQIKKYI